MSRLSLSSLRAPEAPTSRLALLVGQSFALGLTLALLVVAANALFLPEFGSGSLPYVYITVAVLGSLLFYGYAELERRWTLPALSITTLAILALGLLVYAWRRGDGSHLRGPEALRFSELLAQRMAAEVSCLRRPEESPRGVDGASGR